MVLNVELRMLKFLVRNIWRNIYSCLYKLAVTTSVITIIFISAYHLSYGQQDCELKISKDSIFVYTCKNPNSGVKTIKANFTISTKASVFAGHLLNVPDYIHWQYNSIQTKVLKVESENELFYRSEIEAPWPVTNRELVVKLKITQDPQSKIMWIEIKNAATLIPETENLVRIKKSYGKYIVTPIDTNKLQVDYFLDIDPGGSIPDWILNMAIAEGPYQTFKNLIDRINSGIKIQAATFIID
ncbi:MAG: hypothetical protein IPP71_03955 [Bacteroidetes bacterium]|nr:hypothetical protein [Bacteroidota bacterium]